MGAFGDGTVIIKEADGRMVWVDAGSPSADVLAWHFDPKGHDSAAGVAREREMTSTCAQAPHRTCVIENFKANRLQRAT